jgi:hypothetical protein
MNDFREITWDALVGRTGHMKRLLQLQRESGEEREHRARSRAPLEHLQLQQQPQPAGRRSLRPRSRRGRSAETGGKVKGGGKLARLRRSRARWDGTRFGERGASDSDKKARDSRAQHLLVLFAAVQSCRCCGSGRPFKSQSTLSLSCFFFPPFTAAKYMGEVCRMQCRNGEGQSDRGR